MNAMIRNYALCAAIAVVSLASCIQVPSTEVETLPTKVPAGNEATATKQDGTSTTVVASFYSDALANQKTASGEPYKPEEMTAAHKTLPLGTIVEVKNPENGKSVEVKINDRGPFVKGRSLDLSRAAAERVGLNNKKGVAKLKIKKVKATSKSVTTAQSKDSTSAPGDTDHAAQLTPAPPSRDH